MKFSPGAFRIRETKEKIRMKKRGADRDEKKSGADEDEKKRSTLRLE